MNVDSPNGDHPYFRGYQQFHFCANGVKSLRLKGPRFIGILPNARSFRLIIRIHNESRHAETGLVPAREYGNSDPLEVGYVNEGDCLICGLSKMKHLIENQDGLGTGFYSSTAGEANCRSVGYRDVRGA